MLIYVLRWRPSWISYLHKKQKFCFSKRQNNCEELNTRFHAKFPAAGLKNPYCTHPLPCNTAHIITPPFNNSVEEQTRKNYNFPVRGIFNNPREIIVNIFRYMALHKPKQLYVLGKLRFSFLKLLRVM
jgi:hypothetical protein